MAEVIQLIPVDETEYADGIQEVVDVISVNDLQMIDTGNMLIVPEVLDTGEVLPQSIEILKVVEDHQCVTCHRLFQSEEMLKEHLEVCREDDSRDIYDFNTSQDYDTEDEEDAVVISYNDSSPSDSQNSSGSKPLILPVPESKCHCCGEDKKTAHSGGPHKCKDCDLSFKKQSSLNRHTTVQHWESKSCKCKECGACFNNKKDLHKHRYTTHLQNKKVYKCEKCDTYFSRSYHLNRHLSQSACNAEKSNSFSCVVCDKVFTRKDNLREHLRSHAGVPQRKKKTCSMCPKEFHTNQQLLTHERMHRGERPVECDLCSKTFLTELAMKKHRRVHTGEKPFECRYCKKRFAARETLNRHQRTHTGEKPHICQYCNKAFIQAAQLRAHIFHHTGENGFYCDVCGKAFNRKARLTSHKQFVHEGATPFTCETCNKAFTRKEDLNKHLNLHAGIKPHKCNHCGKCFAAKSSLQAHLNTHRREPPQSCAECGRAFIRHDCLMRHIRAKHRDLLEDVLGEAEKKHLKLEMFNVAYNASEKTKTGETNVLSTDELIKSVNELLTILIDKDTLERFGWLQSPLQDVLEAVVRKCGHEPVSSDSELSLPERMRENIKLVFGAVIQDENVRSLLTTQTIDEVIVYVLNASKDVEEEKVVVT